MADKLLDKLQLKSFDMWEFRIFNADYREVGSDWYSMVEFFPYYRLYYIYDSEGAQITLKSESIKLLPGHIYYIPAFQIVSGKCKSLKHSFIHFAPVSDLIHIFEEYGRVIDIEADKRTTDLFNIVIDNYMNGDISSRFASSGALQILLSKVLYEKKGNLNEIENFSPVFKYVDKNIHRRLSLEELANVMNFNKTYFGNKFKKIYGISPMQYVINKKIMAACRLFTMTDATVKEVAYSLGFESEFYFSRMFKSRTTKTPKEYKMLKNQGGKNEKFNEKEV